jgi:tetratricopeptide (TPR) repeat protein
LRFSAIVSFLSVLCLPVAPFSAIAHPAEVERIEILSQRIEMHPHDPRLYLDRGASYSHDGKYALAMKDFQKAAELGDPVSTAYELGLLYHRNRELSKAKAEFDRFLVRFPNHPGALEKRARLLAELGDVQGAVSDYERMFEVTPRPNPGSYLSAAKLLAADAEAGTGPALHMLDRGMERLGVIPQLQLERDAETWRPTRDARAPGLEQTHRGDAGDDRNRIASRLQPVDHRSKTSGCRPFFD